MVSGSEKGKQFFLREAGGALESGECGRLTRQTDNRVVGGGSSACRLLVERCCGFWALRRLSKAGGAAGRGPHGERWWSTLLGTGLEGQTGRPQFSCLFDAIGRQGRCVAGGVWSDGETYGEQHWESGSDLINRPACYFLGAALGAAGFTHAALEWCELRRT